MYTRWLVVQLISKECHILITLTVAAYGLTGLLSEFNEIINKFEQLLYLYDGHQ